MEYGRVMNNIINAYFDLRSKLEDSMFWKLNVVIKIQPKIFSELLSELHGEIGRTIDNDCYFISLCGRKTPILITRELPEQVEFQMMTQRDYERQEKEMLMTKFNQMFE